MINIIWEKLPVYVKYPALAVIVLIWTPIKIYESAKLFVQSEVHAYVLPLKAVRDLEIGQMKDDLATIKQDTRDIRNHLLGARHDDNSK